MADAIGREYKTRPTDILGLSKDWSPTLCLMVDARILSYRNEQARLMAEADTGKGPSTETKIKARRAKWEADRQAKLKAMGVNE